MREQDLTHLRASLIEALNSGNSERLQSTGRQMAEMATTDIPIFHAALNALGYHNELALVNHMMGIAWPQLQDEPGYSRPAVDAFAARATDHLLYAFLEGGNTANGIDQALVTRLETYFPVDEERLRPYLQLLSGTAGRSWSAADFEPLQMQALNGLMVEFTGYAHRVQIPQARAHLVRELLPRYLLDRQAGNLQPKPDMAAALREGRRPFPQPPREPLHPLAPDRPSLKLFLERLLQTVHPHYYMSAAILSLIPHWLTFLQVRNLLAGDIARQSRDETGGLQQELASFWADHPDQALRDFV